MESVIELINSRIAHYEKKVKSTEDFTAKETAKALLENPECSKEELASKIMRMQDIIKILKFTIMELEWLKKEISEG